MSGGFALVSWLARSFDGLAFLDDRAGADGGAERTCQSLSCDNNKRHTHEMCCKSSPQRPAGQHTGSSSPC